MYFQTQTQRPLLLLLNGKVNTILLKAVLSTLDQINDKGFFTLLGFSIIIFRVHSHLYSNIDYHRRRPTPFPPPSMDIISDSWGLTGSAIKLSLTNKKQSYY